MVNVGLLSNRTQSQLLQGVVRTFGANLRSAYQPQGVYSGRVRLVQVPDSTLSATAWQRKQAETIAGWRQYASQLEEYLALGNHMTVLKPPHVNLLAELLFGRTECTNPPQSIIQSEAFSYES
jgi:thioesterase domain-containing protein